MQSKRLWRPRRTITALTAAVVTALLSASVGVSTAAQATATPTEALPAKEAVGASDPTHPGRLIVRTAAGANLDEVASAIAATGGTVVATFDDLSMIVVDPPIDGAENFEAAVAAVAGVDGLSPDRAVGLSGLGFDPDSQGGSMTSVTRQTGATSLWQQGITGKGVDIALIDTGCSPVKGLKDPNKVVVGPDLSFDVSDIDTRYLDAYGHGSHMAGIIAGRDGGQQWGGNYAWDRDNFYGMAPDARLVCIKVGDRHGAVDVSQIIAAIQWVIAYGKTDGLNIRILNLSFGLDSPSNPSLDPLSWVAEKAASKGFVVVASAGNQGGSYAGLNSPAYNSNIIAVGATDTNGTDWASDDWVPWFSAYAGGSVAKWRAPDVVAPGVGIVSSRVPGSVLSDEHWGAHVGDGLMRGSGTSQAAAVVSGGVALLLQQRPALTPNQVKDLLTSSATWLDWESWEKQGYGTINLAAAAARPTPVNRLSPAQNGGLATIDAARGGVYVAFDGVPVRGEQDVWGRPWIGAGRSNWTSPTTWNGTQVAGGGFTTDWTTAAGQSWSGRSWAGRSWAGRSWAGRSWAGRSWAGNGWNYDDSWWTPIDMTRDNWASSFWAEGGWG